MATVTTLNPSIRPVSASTGDDPVASYLARLAPGSRRTMVAALDTIAGLLTDQAGRADQVAWHRLGYADTIAVRAHLAARYAPATANRYLSALRGVLTACRRLGLMTAEAHAAAVDLPAVRGQDPEVGRHLSAEERSRLLAVCTRDASPAGDRDAALIALLFAGGLRRSEAVALTLADLDPTDCVLTVRFGKGGRGRRVYLPAAAWDHVDRWLAWRPGAGDTDPLLCPVGKTGRIWSRRMSAQACYARLGHRADQAGLDSVCPHDARRTYIGELLDAGVDLAVVAELVGHASMTTTARYDRRGERTKHHAARQISFP